MKLTQFGCVALTAAAAVSASVNAVVYEFSANSSIHDNVVASLHDSTMYLADKLGVGDYYSLGSNSDLSVQLVNMLHGDLARPNVVVMVKGVDTPESLFETPALFEIALHKGDAHKLVKTLFGRVPRQYSHVADGHVTHLSHEIKVVAPETHAREMKKLLRRTIDELPLFWQAAVASAQNPVALLGAGLNVLNDKLFISEFLQVSQVAEHARDGLVVANLDLLLLLGTKLGYNSQTYQVAKKTLARAITTLAEQCDVTVVVFSPAHRSACHQKNMHKRSAAYSDAFALFAKRNSVGAGACYADEAACTAGTNACSGHGVCAKTQAKCWQCACKPTFDKKLSKTTVWTGPDCLRRDIAAQANLLLWTSVALIVALVMGTRLLFSMDSEPLPGVLEAATVKRST